MQESTDGVQERRSTPDTSDGDLEKFEAKIVLHLLYTNRSSAAVAGHKQNDYAVAKVNDKRWFENKDAFMALICKAFERFWDEMKMKND